MTRATCITSIRMPWRFSCGSYPVVARHACLSSLGVIEAYGGRPRRSQMAGRAIIRGR